MTDKMTNAKALTYVLENTYDLPEDVKEKLEKMLEQTLKKNAGTAGATSAKAVENQQLGEILLDFMEDNTVYTITELIHKVEAFSEFSTSKMTAIITPLKEQGFVKRTVSKGKTYWEKA